MLEEAAGVVAGAAGLMAYAVRAPASSLLGPSVHHGCKSRAAIALTFDDGPSEGTPEILSILEKYRISATFFQCGANTKRLPLISQSVISSGHEIGNHTQTHPNFCFRSQQFINKEFGAAQLTIEDVVGRSPSLMRAPFGVRWVGFRQMQQRYGLLGVMWTTIGKDWKLPAENVARRLLKGARNGAIFCLHDGRELTVRPNIAATVEALRIAIPQLVDRGFQFDTVNGILCPKN